MKSPEEVALDPFLADVEALEGEAARDGIALLEAELAAVAPAAELRARLLSGAVLADRFARFAPGVAQLLDVSLDKAKAILARADTLETYSQELPGISFLWVEGGPSVQDAVRGFVRVRAGTIFPDHEHFGEENVLILQGSYVDTVSGEVFRPGDRARMSAGSSHALVVPPDGPDLLKLAVVQKGLQAGPKRYEPR